MKKKILLCLGALLCIAAVDVAKRHFELPRAKLTVKVVDEQGAPVQGARVTLTFMDSVTHQGYPVEGLSDASGLFSGEGGSDSTVGGSVRKEGYYWGGFPFTPFREADKVSNRWLPWDATYVSVLRPIIKPIPMYARIVWLQLPEVGQPCGYDLMAGDWVAPWGKGQVSDFVFTWHRDYESVQRFAVSVTLNFSSRLDGIQETQLPKEFATSTFAWPRLAPETGYATAFKSELSNSPEKSFQSSAKEDQRFYFRVRTVEQNGRIVSALYGKISGGLQLGAVNSKTGKVYLYYYLNPTSLDRNMEFDLARNLFRDLKDEEKPRDP